MDKFWSFIGLASKLDESGEGYEPSTFSRLLAVPSKSDYKPIGFDKIYNGKKKVRFCKRQRTCRNDDLRYVVGLLPNVGPSLSF